MPNPKLTLYTRADCTLCEQALAAIRRVELDVPLDLEIVQLADGAAPVPILAIDGERRLEGKVSEFYLRRELAALGYLRNPMFGRPAEGGAELRLTVLGCQSPYPGPGGAGPGYLLEAGEVAVLIDCGSGVVAQLGHRRQPHALTALLISHWHFDHVSDLPGLAFAQSIARREGLRAEPLPAYAPADASAWREELRKIDAVQLTDIEAESRLAIGPFRFSFLRTDHPVPALAIRAEAGRRRIVYTADTAPLSGLAQFARGADLLLTEASFLERHRGRGPGHMTAGEAAQLGKEAGVGEVWLTHLFPEYDRQALLAEARSVRPDAELADVGKRRVWAAGDW